MEKQNTEGNNQMKKTLIICGSILAVAVIAMVCIIILTNQNQNQTEILNGGMMMDPSEMTFEEFCMGMKKDLSPEIMEEVRRLFDEMKKAYKNNQEERIGEIYEELNKLDVYDNHINLDMGDFDIGDIDFSDMDSGSVIIMDENGNVIEGNDSSETD